MFLFLVTERGQVPAQVDQHETIPSLQRLEGDGEDGFDGASQETVVGDLEVSPGRLVERIREVDQGHESFV